ncbi:MAG: CPBP family intramembrane metalloprotease, partial [Planctomycetales bacterium]|nr:CPBP family intramembrane metalloprotease [Planctomycetales bacterium]
MKENTLPVSPELLEQNPWLALLLSLFSLLVLAVLLGGLASWIFLGIRAQRGQRLLPLEPWSPRVWGLLDVLVVAVLAVSCQLLFGAMGIRLLDIDPESLPDNAMPLALTLLISLGNVAAVALGVGWIMLRFGVSPAHVGFRGSRFPQQLAVGAVATLATLPLIYLLMAAVSIGFDSDYQHPLLEEMKASATLSSFLLGGITAVFIAPLTEEFLFRVVIQGWLQSLSLSSLTASVLGASQQARRDPTSPAYYRLSPQFSSALGPQNMESVPSGELQEDRVQDSELPDNEVLAAEEDVVGGVAEEGVAEEGVAEEGERGEFVTPPLWPSIVTGILFGLAHWGYGLSFI